MDHFHSHNFLLTRHADVTWEKVKQFISLPTTKDCLISHTKVPKSSERDSGVAVRV